MGGDKCTHWVVMGTDSIDFLQGLDVPHLRETRSGETRKDRRKNCSKHITEERSREVDVTYDDGAVGGATVQPVAMETENSRNGFKESVAILSRYELYNQSLSVLLCVCVFQLPLDTQSQHDAIVALEGFLTLVGGAGVPHLRGTRTSVILC